MILDNVKQLKDILHIWCIYNGSNDPDNQYTVMSTFGVPRQTHTHNSSKAQLFLYLIYYMQNNNTLSFLLQKSRRRGLLSTGKYFKNQCLKNPPCFFLIHTIYTNKQTTLSHPHLSYYFIKFLIYPKYVFIQLHLWKIKRNIANTFSRPGKMKNTYKKHAKIGVYAQVVVVWIKWLIWIWNIGINTKLNKKMTFRAKLTNFDFENG